MIRPAAPEDFPAMIEMGRRFHEAAGLDKLGPYDEASARQTLRDLVEGPGGIALVAVHGAHTSGMIGGLVYPLYLSRGVLTAQEVFWWADRPGDGVKLYRAFEREAKRRGARSIQMIGLDGMKSVETLYRRLGFEPLERHYVKVL